MYLLSLARQAAAWQSGVRPVNYPSPHSAPTFPPPPLSHPPSPPPQHIQIQDYTHTPLSEAVSSEWQDSNSCFIRWLGQSVSLIQMPETFTLLHPHFKGSFTVLRIRDILVWIRIRRSAPRTDWSGFGSGSGSWSGSWSGSCSGPCSRSCPFRKSPSRCQQKYFFFF